MADINFDQIAYESAPIGIVLTQHRIVKSCNLMFAEMLGYQKDEVLEQSFRMFYQTRKEFDNVRDIGIKPLKEKGVYTDERLVKRKDGDQIWCRFRAQTLTREAPLAKTIMSYAVISQTTHSFTPREREVILYLSKGLTSKEIAIELSMSPRSIEDIRLRLHKKMSVKNATELLAKLAHIPT